MITYIIIGITVIVSYSAFNNGKIFDALKFNAYDIVHRKKHGKILSHALVHADWMHLVFNMLTLYIFGPIVEEFFYSLWGAKGLYYYILMYVSAAGVSSVYSLYVHKDNWAYNAIGASGAVSAILFASILFMPVGQIRDALFPVPIYSFIYGAIFLFGSYRMSKMNIDNIGHDAHFWGAVYGFVFPLFFKPDLIFSFFKQISQIFS